MGRDTQKVVRSLQLHICIKSGKFKDHVSVRGVVRTHTNICGEELTPATIAND